MVEFALIAPLLLIIIFGIMELALMFNAYQQVHYAAFVAARSAIVMVPAAYPKGPDEDREDPYLMAQTGSKTPKKDAMELAAEIAMIPVSSPFSAIVADGLGSLPSLLSGLDTQFNQLMSDAGMSGTSADNLPFADFFNRLGNPGSLGNAGDILNGLNNVGSLSNILHGLPGLGSSLEPETAGRAFARFHPLDLLDRNPPGSATAWAMGGSGGGAPSAPNIPGMPQVHVGEMTVPGELGLPDILIRSADKFITSMLATKARAIDPITKAPLPDDFSYRAGEPLTVRVTHYYNPKMPIVRKIFWKAYLTFGIRAQVHEYMESSGISGALPAAVAAELEDHLVTALVNFLGGIDLPYYPIPIHAEATLQVEGDRWCSGSLNNSLDPCPY